MKEQKNDKDYRKSQMSLCDIQMFVGITLGAIFAVVYPFYYDLPLSELAKCVVLVFVMLLFVSFVSNRSVFYVIKYSFAMYVRGAGVVWHKITS